MACGRPVIISDLPPIREVVEDEQTALLVPPGDAGKLADALRRVLADEVLAVQMTRRASEIVSKYSWVQRAESLDDLFQAVVNSG
jgi:glycosyltransferase involved in cell wall biosynthesis|tara:strand:- start:105 stop:359 length:255 start_codon:yes stop_codon:yes gene_type:complete